MARFQLHNFEKVGRGVDKGVPQKRHFFRFWDILFGKFWKLIVLNFEFFLFALPAIIIGFALYISFPGLYGVAGLFVGWGLMGPAICGMVYILRNYAMEKPVFLWMDYKDAVKNNWKQGLLFSLMDMIVIPLLAYAIYNYFQGMNEDLISTILLAAAGAVGFVYLFMHYYMYLMIVTLDLPFTKLLKNAAIFSITALRTNLFTTVFAGGIWFVTWLLWPYTSVVLLLVGVSIPFFIITFNSFAQVKKVILDPYYQSLEEKDTPDEEEEEAVFTDIGSQEVPVSHERRKDRPDGGEKKVRTKNKTIS